MISLRIGLLPAVLTLGLTACGQSISPFPGFNSGIATTGLPPNYVERLGCGGLETYDRGGRLVAVSGPLVDREDLPMEIFSSSDEPIELAARLDTLPIPLIRPAIDPEMDYGVVEEIQAEYCRADRADTRRHRSCRNAAGNSQRDAHPCADASD